VAARLPYIPLGGNRKGEVRTYINLLLTMLLGGLWHGASWNFLIWGGIHGGMLAIERRQGKDSFYARLPRVLRMAITFCDRAAVVGVLRSADLPGAISYLGCMFGMVQPQAGAA
jgi:alginate O-acetyltransferase complex protein AlgI